MEIVSVIGMQVHVSRAGLRYTRDYLTAVICILLRPGAMVIFR